MKLDAAVATCILLTVTQVTAYADVAREEDLQAHQLVFGATKVGHKCARA